MSLKPCKHEVIVLEYLPWDCWEGDVRLYLPDQAVEVRAAYFGEPEVMQRHHPVNTRQWDYLLIHWMSGGELTDSREKKLTYNEAVGFCKAKVADDSDGSNLVIVETIIDLVADEEILGELADTIRIGDWVKISNANALLCAFTDDCQRCQGSQV